ncbi:MAG TPA: ABC transporter substrate-binding protein [Sneathiellales bacterium]|nr:ABC transporter substrate-binding protein [Sneathiellales bacterium]
METYACNPSPLLPKFIGYLMTKNLVTISRRSTLTIFFALALLTALPVHAASSQAPDAKDAVNFVSTLAHKALGVLKETSENDLSARKTVFRDILTEGFDLKAIGRLVLGRHWRAAGAEQRTEYLHLFSEYVLKTYSSMLGGYTDEKFEIGKARPTGKADMLVESRIVRSNGPPVVVNWRVRIIGDKYRVIDISVEGVSMVLTKRSEFSSVIKNKGFDALLTALQPRT